MVTVAEAFRIILSNLYPGRTVAMDIGSSAGYVLAETISADRDFPPFDRVAMDGIAISFAAYKQGRRQFAVEGVQPAGSPPKILGDTLMCIEVMTGAVLPSGTDTVIRYEDLRIEGGIAYIEADGILPGQNIHRRGADAKRGHILIETGIKITPAEVALFAATGKGSVRVCGFPATAIVSSGDELIDVGQNPESHQVRRSNVFAIQAAMREMGWAGNQFHFRDDREELLEGLGRLLEKHDVLILSGGVSKGKYDFIPEVLESLGVQKKFHQVGQRPGKPFWFGVSAEGKTVFALPGNPVSTYLCFYRFVRPWMEASMGVRPSFYEVILGADVNVNLPMTYFLQVKVIIEQGMLIAYPRAGGGSGDFSNLKEVSGFLELPPSATGFRKGDTFPYIPFRSA